MLYDHKLKQNIDQEFEEYRRSIKKSNVLVLGQTGVGKSSLVNLVFGEDIAKISNVRPETRGFNQYESPVLPINIIDSEGYELSNSQDFITNFKTFYDEKFVDVKEQIHLAWYCINVSGARVLPFDIEIIKFLVDHLKIPTAVVFTQCDLDDEEGSTAKKLSEVIHQTFGSIMQCFQISSDSDLKLDLESLISWSSDNISDDNVKAAFILSQKASLKSKFQAAQKIIYAATLSAAGVAASPIPGSDAVLLIPIQTIMALKIFNIYGINQGVSDILRKIISGRIMTTLGKSLVGNLLKLVPGAGSVIGGTINAVVASSLTYSFGYALSKIAEKLFDKHINGLFNEETISTILTEENIAFFMQQYKNKKADETA